MPFTPIPGPSPLIRMDLFPAIMRPGPVSDGAPYDPRAPYHEQARVIITQDAMWAFVDQPGGPDLHFYARIDDITGSRQTGYTVTYTTTREDGTTIQTAYTLIPAGGCGCGSLTKSFLPWTGGMRYGANTF